MAVAKAKAGFTLFSKKKVSTEGNDGNQEQLVVTDSRNQIFGNLGSFALIKSSGCVITWGNPVCGGDSDAVQEYLASGVREICSNDYAFAAVKDDGSVISWGNPPRGGDSAVDPENEVRSGPL